MAYDTDLTDDQWKLIEHHFSKNGHRSLHDKRDLINGVFYLTKTGCQWRMLPESYPPYSTVHTFYRRCRISGKWEKIMQDLVKEERVKRGRNPDPSYSLMDSQSVKTTGAADKRGIDGGKKNKRS